MYETEEELDRYFGNNKKRVFTVKVTVTDDNDCKREFTDQFTWKQLKDLASAK